MIKVVIFDCFGVVRVDATLNAYKKLGGDAEADADFIKDTIARANAGLIPNSSKAISERLGVSEQKWRQTVQNSSEIDYELLDFIAKLHKNYKTAMLSNVARGGLKLWFEPGFLDKYFDVVIGSGDIGYAKPEPQAYEITAEKLGVRLSECVMVDDRLELCEGARAVGMPAVHYQSFKQMKKELEALLAAVSDN